MCIYFLHTRYFIQLRCIFCNLSIYCSALKLFKFSCPQSIILNNSEASFVSWYFSEDFELLGGSHNLRYWSWTPSIVTKKFQKTTTKTTKGLFAEPAFHSIIHFNDSSLPLLCFMNFFHHKKFKLNLFMKQL